ncbi:MAG: DnaJ domain-containing protein [Cyanobacteriota bacterium]|nr:DnaJ domain-containing protein [Cyanobacteriota bacterium]
MQLLRVKDSGRGEETTVQVALDYYRILMLPIQADDRQIEQAYRERIRPPQETAPDRSLWPGFSPQALQGREQLLQEAASVLLDPQQRQNYDAHMMAANPSLDIPDPLLPAALLILCETGDFQAALQVSEALLAHPSLFHADALLTMGIARLELGREAWQQGSFEQAAQSLEFALHQLEHQKAFPDLQAELKESLGHLRPYRILHLLGLDESDSQRAEGLSLLQGMLQERRGIEGLGQDGSTFSTEDFLRFVQRLRRQMTLAEQQELFEREADRPSMVATYLAVQVLLARGYVENRPALVRRGRGYLARLAQRQDVHLEQAICSLLLGQTEKALHHLQQAREPEPLRFIQEQSAGSPDWLPGLCQFTERWFEQEIFPEFRGLEVGSVDLRTYFDNPQVQAYLDEMLTSGKEDSAPLPSRIHIPNFERAGVAAAAGSTWNYGLGEGWGAAPHPEMLSPQPPQPRSDTEVEGMAVGRQGRGDPSTNSAFSEGMMAASAPQRGAASTEVLPPRMADLPAYANVAEMGLRPPSQEGERWSGEVGDPTLSHRHRPSRKRSPRSPSPAPLLRLAGGVGVVVVCLVVIVQIVRGLLTPTPPGPTEQPQVQLDQAPVEIPEAAPTPPPAPTIPPDWQGVQQVRVVSSDGIRIRQQPSLEAGVVGAAPAQSSLRVVKAQLGTDGQVPLWLQVEPEGSPGGWVAAQLGNTPLVEKLP